jgi:hypothetical protein
MFTYSTTPGYSINHQRQRLLVNVQIAADVLPLQDLFFILLIHANQAPPPSAELVELVEQLSDGPLSHVVEFGVFAADKVLLQLYGR